jgi:hypothetical protein
LILEAFSQALLADANRGRVPEHVLFEWLSNILLLPPSPDDLVGKVIHAEIAMIDCNGFPAFEGKSPTGNTLLQSLHGYCRSFDHWQFTRWLHERQATDFKRA